MLSRQKQPGQRMTNSLPLLLHNSTQRLLLRRWRRSILIARRRWRSARTRTLTHATMLHAIAALMHGLLELLLLSIRHQRFQLLVGLHHRIAHLSAALLGSQIRIVPERFHPLVLVLQDRQHLLLLIGAQIQHLCQVTQLTLRAWRMMMPHRLLARLLV